MHCCDPSVDRDSQVGIVTCYGLNGLGIGSRRRRDFPHTSWPSPPSLLYNGYRVFPESKAAGACRWPPTPTNAKVKERVGLCTYSPSGPSWLVLGWILPLPLPCDPTATGTRIAIVNGKDVYYSKELGVWYVSSVGIVTRLQYRRPRKHVPFPTEPKGYFFAASRIFEGPKKHFIL